MDRIRTQLGGAFLALILAGIAAAPALAKDVFESAPTQSWKLGAIKTADKGDFSYCAIEADFDNRMRIAFARNPDNQVNLAMGFPEPSLGVGERTPLMVWVDEGDKRALVGLSVAADLLLIPLGEDPDLYESMRTGNRLYVEGPSNSFAMVLKGTAKALADLRDCVVNKGKGAEAEVVASLPNVPARPGAIPTALEEILARARLGDVKPIQLGGDPRTRVVDFAWNVGTLFGGVKEMRRPENVKFTEMLAGYLKFLQDRCAGGKFSSELATPETVGPIELATGTIGCRKEDSDRVAAILFYATDQLFTVLFHETAPDQMSYAGEANNRVTKIIRELAISAEKQGAKPKAN